MAEAEDLKTFIRELLIRFERVAERSERAASERQRESLRYFETIRAEQREQREKLDEILAEGRAGRRALFRILDRLDGNGGAAGAS
jgi:hypothetical protein